MDKRDAYDSLPLGRYAVLGDGRSVALLGADGAVDWWCLPSLDSVPFLDRLLAGAEGGRFAITPEAPFEVERRYREDSNVLEQVFRTEHGSARITSSLNSGISGRLPWSELAQRIEGLEGSVRFRVELRPGWRMWRATPWLERNAQASVMHVDGLLAAFRMTDDIAIERADDDAVIGGMATSPGSRSLLALLASFEEPLILPGIPEIDRRIDRSDQSWKEWAGLLHYRGPYEAVVRRSALALKLLLFSPTGAIAAAGTSSLPERIGGDKNYDYRYAWVRDVAYTITAFLGLGAVEEAKAAFSWLTATIIRNGDLRTMYSLDGSLAPAQEALDLPGWRDSRPVLVGNKAREQRQLSIYGDILETAFEFVEGGHVIDLVTRRLLANLADQAADGWRQKDSGIWELGALEHYTFSKLGCWTALDRAVRMAEAGQIDGSRCERWRRERDHIADWIDARCWSERLGAYTMYPGTDRLDAALLLAVRTGYAREDRLGATRDAIRASLARGPLVFRYSGAEREEGTFLACAAWMVQAYAVCGAREEGHRLMRALLDRTQQNLGLLTEQQDPDTDEALGNTPQALSHLALVHAALALRDPSGGDDAPIRDAGGAGGE